MNVRHSANKQQVLQELLQAGMVLVALDARKTGVDVPDHLAGDSQLRLNLSYRFGLPIKLDPWGVSATLTFNGSAYACRLPWAAIFLLVSHTDGQPYLFPDDIPAELVTQASEELHGNARTKKEAASKKAERPKLSLVPSEKAADLGTKPRARSRRQPRLKEAPSADKPTSQSITATAPTTATETRPPPAPAVKKAKARTKALTPSASQVATTNYPTTPKKKEGGRAKQKSVAAKPQTKKADAQKTPLGPAKPAAKPGQAPDRGDEAPDKPRLSRGHLHLVK